MAERPKSLPRLRAAAARELLESEKAYLLSLYSLVLAYVLPLRGTPVSKQSVDTLCSAKPVAAAAAAAAAAAGATGAGAGAASKPRPSSGGLVISAPLQGSSGLPIPMPIASLGLAVGTVTPGSAALPEAAAKTASLLTSEEQTHIFRGVELLLPLHLQLLADLHALLEAGGLVGRDAVPGLVDPETGAPFSWKDDTLLGPTLARYAAFFRIYSRYTSSFAAAGVEVTRLLKERPAFARFVAAAEADPSSRGQTLESLLAGPMQRVPRYVLLVKQLLAYTPEGHPDRPHVEAALNAWADVAAHLNAGIAREEGQGAVVELESRLVPRPDPPLVAPSRMLLKDGVLGKLCQRVRGGWGGAVAAGMAGMSGSASGGGALRPYLVFLLSDLLVYGSPADGPSLKLPGEVQQRGSSGTEATPRREEEGEAAGVASHGGGASSLLPSLNAFKGAITRIKLHHVLSLVGVEDLSENLPASAPPWAPRAFRVLAQPKSVLLVAASAAERAAWVTAIRDTVDALNAKRRSYGLLPLNPATDAAKPPPALETERASSCAVCGSSFSSLGRHRRTLCVLCGHQVCNSCSQLTLKLAAGRLAVLEGAHPVASGGGGEAEGGASSLAVLQAAAERLQGAGPRLLLQGADVSSAAGSSASSGSSPLSARRSLDLGGGGGTFSASWEDDGKGGEESSSTGRGGGEDDGDSAASILRELSLGSTAGSARGGAGGGDGVAPARGTAPSGATSGAGQALSADLQRLAAKARRLGRVCSDCISGKGGSLAGGVAGSDGHKATAAPAPVALVAGGDRAKAAPAGDGPAASAASPVVAAGASPSLSLPLRALPQPQAPASASAPPAAAGLSEPPAPAAKPRPLPAPSPSPAASEKPAGTATVATAVVEPQEQVSSPAPPVVPPLRPLPAPTPSPPAAAPAPTLVTVASASQPPATIAWDPFFEPVSSRSAPLPPPPSKQAMTMAPAAEEREDHAALEALVAEALEEAAARHSAREGPRSVESARQAVRAAAAAPPVVWRGSEAGTSSPPSLPTPPSPPLQRPFPAASGTVVAATARASIPSLQMAGQPSASVSANCRPPVAAASSPVSPTPPAPTPKPSTAQPAPSRSVSTATAAVTAEAPSSASAAARAKLAADRLRSLAASSSSAASASGQPAAAPGPVPAGSGYGSLHAMPLPVMPAEYVAAVGGSGSGAPYSGLPAQSSYHQQPQYPPYPQQQQPSPYWASGGGYSYASPYGQPPPQPPGVAGGGSGSAAPGYWHSPQAGWGGGSYPPGPPSYPPYGPPLAGPYAGAPGSGQAGGGQQPPPPPGWWQQPPPPPGTGGPRR